MDVSQYIKKQNTIIALIFFTEAIATKDCEENTGKRQEVSRLIRRHNRRFKRRLIINYYKWVIIEC